MTTRPPDGTFDVAVVGAGMAGMSAAILAAEEGLSCVQVGNGGGILFASGLLDLLAVHPVASGVPRDRPYEALEDLRRDLPDHPLSRVPADRLREAFRTVTAALGDGGLPYRAPDDRNRAVLTSLGTAKTTHGLPLSMADGADALDQRLPCLLVDFRGLREFSARQVADTAGAAWPGLRCARVEFPGSEAASELYAVHLARALESRPVRDEVLARVRPHLGDARAAGFPAVLGLSRSRQVHEAFREALGVPVFEIPTMPTSVPGLRLRTALEQAVASRGVRRILRASVTGMAFSDVATLALTGLPDEPALRARAVILATGRFTGRGLAADRQRVTETVLGLPVVQPGSREAWHRRDFLDPAGHPVNRAGLAWDDAFRPLDATGKPAWAGLHAAGSILAGQDWMREKCGSGLALGTARVAVDAVAARLRGTAAAPAGTR